MKHMNEKYKKEDAIKRPHKESTLEKNQKKRDERRQMLLKQFNTIKEPNIY